MKRSGDSLKCVDPVAIAEDADGNIVLVGSVFAGGGSGEEYPAVARLDMAGQLDLAFGDGGVVISPPAEDYWTIGIDVALQDDGGIVLLADSPYQPTYELARFLST
jgi:hypothetical protein